MKNTCKCFIRVLWETSSICRSSLKKMYHYSAICYRTHKVYTFLESNYELCYERTAEIPDLQTIYTWHVGLV